MGTYIDRDIGLSLEGDINLSSVGDLELATSYETYKSVANFILRTDLAEYQPNSRVGANLGSYVGQHNIKEVHDSMAFSINSSLQGPIFDKSDFIAMVVPFDVNEALCVISIGGNYLIDGVIQDVKGEVLSYVFPYIEGTYIKPITID